MTGVEIVLGALVGMGIAVAITVAKGALVRRVEAPRSTAPRQARESQSRDGVADTRGPSRAQAPAHTKGDR